MNNIEKLKAIDEWQDSNMTQLSCPECGSELHGNIDSSTYEVILSCPQGHSNIEVPNELYERYKAVHGIGE